MTSEISQTYKIGKYSYNDHNIIGIGHYGKVYKGLRLTDMRQVAIKIVDLALHPEKEQLQFIENQLSIHQMINHPRIVESVEIYCKTSVYYFVTEFLDEGDLDKCIREKGALEENDALLFLTQIVQGLAYLKQKRVIHRDLKPSNIFLKNGQAKIADFGLAVLAYKGKILDELRIGTPCYMAPQVLRQGVYTFKSDIWGLGNLFVQMVTGSPPLINCRTFEEITEKVIQPFDSSSIKVSSETKQLLHRMLEINQSKRISIQELLDHPVLASALKHRSSVSTRDSNRSLQIEDDTYFSSVQQKKISLENMFEGVQSRNQVRRKVLRFLRNLKIEDTHYEKLSSVIPKLLNEQKISVTDLVYLSDSLNKKIDILKFETDIQNETEYKYLIELRRIIEGSMGQELL